MADPSRFMKILPYLPAIGIKPKEIVQYFNNLFANFIQTQQETQELTDPKNVVAVMAVVVDGDLTFVPVELANDENGNPTRIVKDFAEVNTSKLIRETDVDNLVKLMAREEGKGMDFFDLLAASKTTPAI